MSGGQRGSSSLQFPDAVVGAGPETVLLGECGLHLIEEDLPPRLLLGVNLLVIAEPQLK